MITTEQNTERQIQRLAAQRQLYSAAKRIFGWQLLISGPTTVVIAILVSTYPSAKVYAALWGITVTLCDLFWLTPWQKRLKGRAARIQEAFDCDVLGLPWNEVKTGKRPGPELVKAQSDKYQTWAKSMPPLTDWYAPVVSEIPLHIGRIACQRSNCWWDAEQRRRYANWVAVGVLLVFCAVFWLSLDNGYSLDDFILRVVAPLAPILLLGLRQFIEQREAASRLDALRDHSEHFWSDALAGRSKTELTVRARSLQDEIFESRCKSPLVFDAIFKRLRRDYETLMIHGVAEYVSEAKQKLKLN